MISMNACMKKLLAAMTIALALLSACTKSDDYASSENSKIEVPGFGPMEMVYVEGGTFMMGSDDDDADSDESPVHEVTLSSFYIGKYEVTQALWMSVMGSNPSECEGDDRRPVENVSWRDCQNFIYELNYLTGQEFRLPTEAEWEYAARGGRKSRGYKYSGSNDAEKVGWFCTSDEESRPVGTKKPNELGIYDMSGNVWEWCQDYYDDYYSEEAQTNPTGPAKKSSRVVRGGGYLDGEPYGSRFDYIRLTERFDYYPSEYECDLGLRLVLPCKVPDKTEKEEKQELQISQSKVIFGEEGGTATVTVHASQNWYISNVPEWLTIEPTVGTAGETTITVSAGLTTARRLAGLYIHYDDWLEYTDGPAVKGRYVSLSVFQTGPSEYPVSTCAEIIAGNDGEVFRARGTCVGITSTTYGNWYLDDETGEIFVYNTLDANWDMGNFTSLGIGVGDIVTVEGIKDTYGSTTELVNVSVVEIEECPIKVDFLSTKDVLFPLEGGDITVYLKCRGDGVSVNIPDNAKSWLSVTNVEIFGTTARVVLNATANGYNASYRTTTVTFVTSLKDKEYTDQTVISQKGVIIDTTVEEFYAATGGDNWYRTTGYVIAIYIDGYGSRYDIRDATYLNDGFRNDLIFYTTNTYAPNYFLSLDIKKGDIVTVVGQKTTHKIHQNEIVAMGEVTVEKRHAVIDLAIADVENTEESTEKYVRLTGEVDHIVDATYGNLYLADDNGNQVYVCGVLAGWGGAKGSFAELGVEEGNRLTIVGNVSSYNGTKQISNAFFAW